METISNDYFIYGISMPYDRYLELNGGDDNIIKRIINNNDISTVFDTRNGKCIIIGRVLNETNNDMPIVVPILDDIDELIIQNMISNIFDIDFDIDGDFHYYYIKTLNN